MPICSFALFSAFATLLNGKNSFVINLRFIFSRLLIISHCIPGWIKVFVDHRKTAELFLINVAHFFRILRRQNGILFRKFRVEVHSVLLVFLKIARNNVITRSLVTCYIINRSKQSTRTHNSRSNWWFHPARFERFPVHVLEEWMDLYGIFAAIGYNTT